ncbi:sulfotransferase [Marivirga sp.]|uniref:sulfotransferase n=1 Tax=Marivirga sp. TaxID=2018662 RepID=UPI0025EF10DB|nr:sulfotransferase [Marivirga sp.]
MQDQNRQDKFKKDAFSEKYLALMNQELGSVDQAILKDIEENIEPTPVFIIGLQRSGTTVFNQLLLNQFNFNYPSNFIARFWNAPLTGLVLQNNLKFEPSQNFKSKLGYTEGLSGPHEFGCFWRHWFPWKSYHKDFKKASIDDQAFQQLIKGMQSLGGNAWLFKNLHQVNFQIETLHLLFPEAVFLYIKREPLFVMQSTYESRLELFGDENQWFGIEPPEFESVKEKSPQVQIAEQVYYGEKYIEHSLNNVAAEKVYRLSFEELINNPKVKLTELNKFFTEQKIQVEANKERNIPELKNSNQIRIESSIIEEMERALTSFYDQNG